MDDRLRRGLFGYSRKSVQEVLNDRDAKIVKTSGEAREAVERATDLAAQLDRARMDLHDVQTRNRELESQLQAAAERSGALEPSETPSSSEELTEVLHATERALAQLTQNARHEAERELERTEASRDRLRSEIERLAAWRARVAPLAEDIPRSVADVRNEASSMPERLRGALSPLTEAVDTLAARLSDLAGSASPPGAGSPRDQEDVVSLVDPGGGSGDAPPVAPIPEAPTSPGDRARP